jgi:DNA polymerase I-like protein with 3'-5' exonuclease and polymerase domains
MRKRRLLAIDTETTGIDKYSLPFFVSTCNENGDLKWWEWDVDPRTRKPIVPEKDKRDILLYCKGKTYPMFNAKFDVEMLSRVGIDLEWRGNIHEVSSLTHIHNNDVHTLYKGKLKPLSKRYLRLKDDDEKALRSAVASARKIASKRKWLINKDEKQDKIATEYWLPRAVALAEGYEPDHEFFSICGEYANNDTTRTMLLFLLLHPLVTGDKVNNRIYNREQRITEITYDMYKRGLSFFPEKATQEIYRYSTKINSSLKTLRRLAGEEYNPESPKQTADFLYVHNDAPVVKFTKKGNSASSDKDALKQLGEMKLEVVLEKFVGNLLSFKAGNTATKYLNSYLYHNEDGFLRPSLNQNGTNTHRFSSQTPNGQNIGKGKELEDGELPEYNIRAVFGPKPGRRWYCIDYSQLQLRIFAYLVGDEAMIESFNKGYDFHGFVASKIYDKDIEKVTKLERRVAKNVNFGFIFGSSPSKIELTSGVSGLWNLVCTTFPKAHDFMMRTKREVLNLGYIQTPSGRKLYLPTRDRGIAAHAGVNYKVQGCEAELVKEAMINVEDALQPLNLDGGLVFQVHDELIFDVPLRPVEEDYKLLSTIRFAMEEPAKRYGMRTPVDIEQTTTLWSEVQKVKIDGQVGDI